MPCIFCIAVFVAVAGAITAARLDQMETALSGVAVGAVQRTTNSASATAFEFSARASATGRAVPVTVTVYKAHQRVRIQVRSHDLDRGANEALQDRIAAALGVRIVDRSSEAEEAPVRGAVEQLDGTREPAREVGRRRAR